MAGAETGRLPDLPYHAVMRDVLASFRLRTLESIAAQAGSAMACTFGSSAELDAALIHAKLQAGAYGPKRRRRYILASMLAAALLTAIVWAALR
jgi:hypothetical protein